MPLVRHRFGAFSLLRAPSKFLADPRYRARFPAAS
jgi:hypothetical protein